MPLFFRHTRSEQVVVKPSLLDLCLRRFYQFEFIYIQALIVQTAVELVAKAIIRRLSWPCEVQLNLMFPSCRGQ